MMRSNKSNSSVSCDFFFFKQKTAYEIVSRDWSSDVCSSDLVDIYLAKTLQQLTLIELYVHVECLALCSAWFNINNNFLPTNMYSTLQCIVGLPKLL